MSYALKHLLPSNISQPAIQFLDLPHNTIDRALILALDLTRLTDRQIDRQLDAAHSRPSAREPAAYTDGGRAGRREAQPV